MNKKTSQVNKSVFVSLLRRQGDKLRASVSGSIIGSFLSSYDRANESFCGSTVYAAAGKMIKSPKVSKLRRTGASIFDKSLLRRSVLSLTCALRHCTMRFYGVFMLTFSMYVLLMYLIRKFGMFYTAPISYVWVSVVVALMSLPLLHEKEKSLGAVLLDSSFFSWLLFDYFELRYEHFRESKAPINRSSVAFIAGMIFGCFSFFVSPVILVLILAFFVYLYLSLVSPESSFLICLFSVPFLSVFEHPTVILCVLVLCFLLGFLFKLFRHKRVLRFGVVEGMLVLFMFFVLFGGMRNASMSVSPEMPVMLILMSGLLAASTLLRTRSMIIHAARALALSCVICAFFGICEYMLGFASLDWIDTEMFSSISGRAVAFFENPNVLGTYLCLGAPLSLCLMGISEDKGRTRWFVGFCLTVVCAVLTWSRGAWLGLAVSIVMMLVCMRHSTVVLFGTVLAAGFGGYLLPQSVIERFLSIGDAADSSTLYRLSIWRGCFDMAGEYGIGGIGVGEDAFLRMYPRYAVAGAERAYHAHSLWLQILLMLGVCGLAVFLIMMFFFYQRAFTAGKSSSDRSLRYVVYGAVSGISGVLISGVFDYTWYNYRVLFVYFVMMGLVCACDAVSAEAKGEMNVCE